MRKFLLSMTDQSQNFQLFSKKKRKRKVSDLEKPITPKKSVNDEIIRVSEVDSGLTFEDLGLGPFLRNSLKNLSINMPTQVQRACIPHALEGKDIIGCAKTGSGKTLAFTLPILQKLSQDPYGIFGLILTPTRELATQIAEQLRAVGECLKLRQSLIVGGMDMISQAQELAKRPHVVVATPGRLADHLKSSTDVQKFGKLKFLVMDEADRLFDDVSFKDDLDEIMSHLPKKVQKLYFSATMSPNLLELKTKNTVIFSTHERLSTISKIDQRHVIVPSLFRDAYLLWILENLRENRTTIVFINKSKICELLRHMLYSLGLPVTALHSQMTQSQRIASLARFRSGSSEILLCTDIGSRGLDIPQVQMVINYDVPCSAVDYVHRVGRTARAGKKGFSLTLVTEMDIVLLENIEKKIGRELKDQTIPQKPVDELVDKIIDAKSEASLYLEHIGFEEKKKARQKN